MVFLRRFFGVKNTHLSSNESVSRHALPAREGDVAEVFRVGPEQGAIPGERSARAYLGREERLGHSGPAVFGLFRVGRGEATAGEAAGHFGVEDAGIGQTFYGPLVAGMVIPVQDDAVGDVFINIGM